MSPPRIVVVGLGYVGLPLIVTSGGSTSFAEDWTEPTRSTGSISAHPPWR
jgi:hypothetical protein